MNSHVIDVNDVQLIVGGNPIQNFASGDAVSFSYPEGLSTSTDANGGTTIIVNNDKTLILTVRLAAGSISNTFLSTLKNLGKAGIVPVSLKDFSTDTSADSLESFVTIQDGSLIGNTERVVTWKITMINASLIVNGVKVR